MASSGEATSESERSTVQHQCSRSRGRGRGRDARLAKCVRLAGSAPRPSCRPDGGEGTSASEDAAQLDSKKGGGRFSRGRGRGRGEDAAQLDSKKGGGRFSRGRGRGRGEDAAQLDLGRGRRRGEDAAQLDSKKGGGRFSRGRGRGTGRSRGKSRGVVLALQPPARPRQEDSDQSTSNSEETQRIQTAQAKFAQWGWRCGAGGGRAEGQPGESQTSDEEAAAPNSSAPGRSSAPIPASSGVFDFAAWVAAHVLEGPDRDALATTTYSYLDLCAGLGTPQIVSEAVHRASGASGTCVAFTETDRGKRESLQQRYGREPAAFRTNGDLAAEFPCDSEGQAINRPEGDLSFFGIDCRSISNCTTTPRSLLDTDGSSGLCYDQFLRYLQALPIERRPKALILECVDNLDHKREVDKKLQKVIFFELLPFHLHLRSRPAP